MKSDVQGKVRLTVVNADADHFVVSFDRPGRIEVSLFQTPDGVRPEIIAHVYEGAEVDPEQSPLFVYDGSERADMRSVTR